MAHRVDLIAHRTAQLRCIGRLARLRDHFCQAGICHLIRRQQRESGLLVQRIETSVPTEAARRRFDALAEAFRDARSAIITPDRRAVQYVAQGGHGASALLIELRAAQLNGTPFGGP